jgi:hypothetical protein
MAYIVTTETTLSDGAINNVDISMPAGHQAGDMTVLMITQDGGATEISVPSGFTQIGTQGSSQAQRTMAMFRIHAGSGEADVNITGATDEWLVTAVLLRGNTALSIHQQTRTNSEGSTSNSLTSGTVTTTVDNCLILSCFGFDNVFKLALDNDSLNKSVNLSKEINIGAVQICQYFNQLTAGTTDTLTALSEVQSEGGTARTIAIAEATPSTAVMSPMITKAYDVLARYGGITTAATTVTAFIRHDGVTWQDVSGNIAATTINSTGVIATPTFAEAAFQGTLSTWGSMTGLSMTGSALDNAGRWMGRTHTIASTNMTGKIFSIEVMMSSVATSNFGEKGIIVYFQDSSNNWATFTVSTRQRLVAAISYVYFVDLENATKLDSGGTIDWTDITRVAYLLHKRTTATSALILRVKNALLLDKVVMVDGSSASPCNPAFLEKVLGGLDPVASGGHGAYILNTVQGKGQSLARFGVQYGDGTRKTYYDASATSLELPLRADSSLAKRFWQVPDISTGAEVRIRASAADTVKQNACVIATDTEQAYIIDPSSSTSASYDFAGSSIIGWRVTHNVAGITINGATLQNCRITLNGGLLDSCLVTNSKASLTTNNPENISNTSFISPGTGHAITITATGTFNFYGNSFSGYGADGSTDAAIYNNSGGAVELVLQAGDPTPTIRNGAGASTTISSPPVTVSATVLANSRVQLYNVTQDTEIDNVYEATTAYDYTLTTEATSGDVLRIRVTKLGYQSIEATAVFSGGNVGFVINQLADDIYDTYGLDGSTVTGFSANYSNTTVERTNTSNFSGASFYAWWNYNLTTEDGIREYYGGVTATDVGNIRINNATVDLNFDITNTSNVYQSDNIRIFRADEAYPVVNPTNGGGAIDLNWRNVVYTVAVAGSPVITGNITDVPSAVWGHGTRTLTSSSGGATLSEIESSTVLAKTTDVTSARDTIQSDIAGLNDVTPNEIWEHTINGKQAQARLQGAEDSAELASIK